SPSPEQCERVLQTLETALERGVQTDDLSLRYLDLFGKANDPAVQRQIAAAAAEKSEMMRSALHTPDINTPLAAILSKYSVGLLCAFHLEHGRNAQPSLQLVGQTFRELREVSEVPERRVLHFPSGTQITHATQLASQAISLLARLSGREVVDRLGEGRDVDFRSALTTQARDVRAELGRKTTAPATARGDQEYRSVLKTLAQHRRDELAATE